MNDLFIGQKRIADMNFPIKIGKMNEFDIGGLSFVIRGFINKSVACEFFSDISGHDFNNIGELTCEYGYGWFIHKDLVEQHTREVLREPDWRL